jgi:hypothetical protein
MVKLTADQRRDLMEVIDDRHDRGSTIVATQSAGQLASSVGIPRTPMRFWIALSTTRIASNSSASRCAVNGAHRVDPAVN